jgi:hypothetical protein
MQIQFTLAGWWITTDLRWKALTGCAIAMPRIGSKTQGAVHNIVGAYPMVLYVSHPV